jgi:NRPS condensation-like uncharacterized protein
MENIPERLPTETSDNALLSWQELGFGEMMIQIELEFEATPDAGRLARALDLALDAQPVLGCRIEPNPQRAVWIRLPKNDRENFFETVNAEEYREFTIEPIDPRTGPQVKACLLRSGAGARFLLKVSHAAADAGGAKEIAADVCAIYNRLGAEPDFTPTPNLEGCRGWDQILRLIPRRAWPRIFLNFLIENKNNMVPLASHTIDLPETPRAPIGYAVRHFVAERVAGLSEFARAHGGTLNDIFAAAFIRALAATGEWDRRSQLRLHMTADMRRWYLDTGRAGGICNLSGFEFINLGIDPGADFAATLDRIGAFMRRRKNNWPGMSSVFILLLLNRTSYPRLKRFFESWKKKGSEWGNLPNTLTNMGPIEPESVTFDGLRPASAWLLTPPIYPPFFGAGLSGYAGTLTLSAGAPSQALPHIESFFDRLVSELPM